MKPNETDTIVLQVLATGPRVIRELRRATGISAPLLSTLFTAYLIKDERGLFSASNIARITGAGDWERRAQLTALEGAGLITKVGGRQYFRSQRWQLSSIGVSRVKDALQRVRSFRSILSINNHT